MRYLLDTNACQDPVNERALVERFLDPFASPAARRPGRAGGHQRARSGAWRQAQSAQDALMEKVATKYGQLREDDVKELVVDDKWLATLAAAVQGELDRVSQSLTGRVRKLAERYATPLPKLNDEVAELAARVDGHLRKMGFAV